MEPKMTKEEIEFLKQSNAIEGVYDDDSLEQAKIAWKYLKEQTKISVGVILKTHKLLMLNQKHLKGYERGYFRTVPVWVGGREGIDYRKIDSAIDEWCKDVMTSIKIPGQNYKHIRLDHVTYEKIHPFVDGNGRTGRMFMNWQCLKAGLPILVITAGKMQQEYYKWFKEEDEK